jgi:hypothetical protein
VLARAKQIGVDGTFSSCPSLFSQFYIILAWCKGECMPAAFVLLGGKKESTYRRMLLELSNGCKTIDLEFIPERIILDFEVGAISAFKFHFPSADFVGCFFHFGQCLFRKLVSLGLKQAYGEDEDLREWFKMCVALAFIPPRKVQDIFADKILDEAPLEKYPVLADFTDYMTETWVDDSSSFEIKLWNHFDSTEERVNNNNEAYNLRIITRLGHVAHPNIWKWVELIQKEEFLQVAVRCAGLLEGSIKPKVRRNHDLERDLTILKAKNKYLTSVEKFDNTVDLLMDCKAAVENFAK